MSGAIWQHTLTVIAVGGFVVMGQPGAARAQQVRGTQTDEGEDLTHLWQPYFDKGLRWNLSHPPRITPEEDTRRKMQVLQRLMGGRKLAQLLRDPPPSAAATEGGAPDLDNQALEPDADDAMASFMDQLRRAEVMRGDREE